jgi:hypothetical protein
VDIKRKIVAGSLALVALAGVGSTAAAAKSGAPTKAPGVASEPIEAQDLDAVQSGDQTSPDQPTAASASEGSGESSSESESGVSDGPGGHEDASGNVDYQFNGEQ